MTTLRLAQVRALIPSVTALTLLLGMAMLTMGVRTERQAAPAGLAEPAATAEVEETMVTRCLRIAGLLEQGRLAEAEPLLIGLPVSPIPMDASPGTEAFQQQSQTLLRLGKAMVQAALQQAQEGNKKEALQRIRYSRALLLHHGNSPQALEVSQSLAKLMDSAESRLQYQLI